MTGIVAFGRLFKPALLLTCAGQSLSSGVPTTGPAFVGDLSDRDLGLRVSFAIERTNTKTPDTCKVSIFNLAPERRDAFATVFATLGRTALSLAIGYDGATVLAFNGDVRSMRKARRNGPDIVTEFIADDGGSAFHNAKLNISTYGMDAGKMIATAIAAMNVDPARPPDALPIIAHPSVAAAVATAVPAATVPATVVSIGHARDLLDEAAKALGCRWWIRDHQVIFAKRNVPTDTTQIAITTDMLLDEPDEDGSGLVRFNALLDPNIAPGMLVAVIPGASVPPVPGVIGQPMIVEACTMVGDTRSGPWAVSVVARKINP